jgi:septum formation protein
LGLPIVQQVPNVDEVFGDGESIEGFLRRIVTEKLRDARDAVSARFAVALAADTVVVLDGEVLGKPLDVADAQRHLRRLAGRSHVVQTCYALAFPAQPPRIRIVSSEVELRAASEAELAAYARTGEGLDKAGAYAAQGIGSFLVRAIRGSYTNVVGLPAAEVVEDLASMGVLGDFPRV